MWSLGGKWKPGSLQSNPSGVGITSYIIDSSSSDGSDVLHSEKRRNSDQTMSQSMKRSIDSNKSQTNVVSKQLNESKEMSQKCIEENNLCNNEERECKSCGFVANDSFNLLKHYLSNHSNSDVFTSESIAKNESNLMKNLSFICEVCSFYTNQSNNYFWHLTTSGHNEKTGSQIIQFECRVCNKICDDVQKLMDHLETNQSIHSNTCGPLIICKLKKMKQKKNNSTKSFDKRLDQFKCDFCFKSFKCKTHLKKHSMTEHIRRVAFPDLIKSNFIGDNPKYSCLKCDFKTDRESTHLLHSFNHEMPVLSSEENHRRKQLTNRTIKRSEDKYECPLCHQLYICRQMKKHINIHLRETPFECIQCDKKFSKMDYLKTHEKTHSGIKDKICKICGTGFVSNKLLSNHLKTHDSNRKKTFGCNECGVMFHTKFVLNQHIKRHLPKSERPFKCNFNGCHLSFVNKSELLSHSRVHSNSDEKCFLCDRCPYKTKSIYSLRKHNRQHTGDKHFECKFCSFKTYLSSNMIRHSRIHSGVKPYRCPYCRYVSI